MAIILYNIILRAAGFRGVARFQGNTCNNNDNSINHFCYYSYVGQQSLYYLYTSTIFFYPMQFVLVLDDGVANVKREDLHIF